MVQAYWKRFAVSVTDFVHRYRFDVFYRTGWNIVLLQLGFTLFLIVLVLGALSLLYDDVLTHLVSSLARTIAEGGIPSPGDNVFTAQDLEIAKQQNMVLASTGVLVLAVIFGWLITRLALLPTRDALASQKQFVGNIAHELRTPLSIIKTNTEVALFDERIDTDVRKILESNIEELDRISSIINNLLSMNRLLNPEKIEFTNVDLKACVDAVTRTLTELIAHKKTHIQMHFAKHRIVWGNFAGIEQILMNLIKNAMHYSPHGTTITIRVEPSLDRMVMLSIEDNGPGIAEKDLQYILEPFYRGDTARNRKSGAGSGLGLTIVSELVKLHKGRIAIRSALGKGTAVSVFLPQGHLPSHEILADDTDRIEVRRDFAG